MLTLRRIRQQNGRQVMLIGHNSPEWWLTAHICQRRWQFFSAFMNRTDHGHPLLFQSGGQLVRGEKVATRHIAIGKVLAQFEHDALAIGFVTPPIHLTSVYDGIVHVARLRIA